MKRLNPLDAQFVDAEDQDRNASFAIALIAIFDGPPPCYEEFLGAVRARLPLVPMYRRKLRTVPLKLGPPVWVDDRDFDLRYHVRQTALPAPGGDAELSALIARVMSQRLDRDYPLWETWVVHGLSDHRWALISKVHHAMVDGVSGTDLYRLIFDVSPDAEPPRLDERMPEAEPGAAWLAARAVAEMAMLPVRTVFAVRDMLSKPTVAARQLSDTARAVAKLAPAVVPAVGSSLAGPIGKHRRYVWARAALDDVKAIKRAFGATVNDVVLAAISAGFRDLLLARGEQPEPHMVPALVPVSLRAPGEESVYENRISVLMADLPVHLTEPVQRLASIRAQLSDLKASHEAMAGEALVALGRFTPYPLASLTVRLAYSLPQPEIVTVTTNVPGPRKPLYAMGRRLVEIIPYVPIAASLRTGISIFSYCGQLTFGVTGDFATTPDIDVLARGIENGVSDLLAAVGPAGAGRHRLEDQSSTSATNILDPGGAMAW